MLTMTAHAESPVPFIDLAAQQQRIGARIQAAIARVLSHGQYILGPEIAELERQLAAFSGARHAITCASGTDALALVLMAQGIGRGDAVVCPAFTFCATAEVVALLGATPVFADVDPAAFNLDPASLEAAISVAKSQGLKPKAVIPVDLFGQPADYAAIGAIAGAHDLFVLADAAQSFGAKSGGRRTGTLAPATATSFFPAKPLGCYGDGGAVLCDDATLAATVKSLRVHGQGTHKYDNVRIGLAGRLDTLQAAILIEKLAIFDDEIAARQRIAAAYSAQLADAVRVPHAGPGLESVWAQYTVRVDAARRDAIIGHLKSRGIPAQIYYPRPLHQQTAYRDFPRAAASLPVAEQLSADVVSLPFHPYLTDAHQARVIEALREAVRA